MRERERERDLEVSNFSFEGPDVFVHVRSAYVNVRTYALFSSKTEREREKTRGIRLKYVARVIGYPFNMFCHTYSRQHRMEC